MDDYEYLTLLSIFLGWAYFLCWSASFYPQAILNHKEKSVAGFSIEYAVLNVSGFLFYSAYSVGGYVFPYLGTGVVQLNDLGFAVHAFAISSIHLAQVFIYPRGTQTYFKIWSVNLLIILWVCILTVFLLEGVMQTRDIPQSVNTFKMAGYSKAVITFFKYWPQAYLNFKRKSTEGFSMAMVMFDFSGGIFSILQQTVDMVYNGKTTGDWSFFGPNSGSFNVVKFLLGVISILFDVLFLIQRYILYRNPKGMNLDQNELKEPLITAKNRTLSDEI